MRRSRLAQRNSNAHPPAPWEGIRRALGLHPNRDYEAERLQESDRQRLRALQDNAFPPSPDQLIPKADLDHAIADAIEQGQRSLETTAVSSQQSTSATARSLGEDVLVGIVSAFIAAPLCDASWHAIVTEGEPVRGLIGLAFGLPLGAAGLTFHWWKSRIDWFGRTSIYWWPIAVVLVFAYVAGPEIYRRSIKPVVHTVRAAALPVHKVHLFA